MIHINLKEGEVVKEGSVLLRVLKEQPPAGYEYVTIIPQNHPSQHASFAKGKHMVFCKLRYPSGEYLVKETYLLWDVPYFNRLMYRADCEKGEIPYVFGYEKSKWRSPVTMPLSAVRDKVTVDTTVEQKDNLWYQVIKVIKKEDV